MSSHLKLFNELPVHAKFRFETPDSGKVFVKTSETSAHHDGAYQKINPGVLVFPVPNPVISVTFNLTDGTKRVADLFENKWRLDADHEEPGQPFNTLEDVINHLGVA